MSTSKTSDYLYISTEIVLNVHESILRLSGINSDTERKLEGCMNRLEAHIFYDQVEDIYEAGAWIAESIAMAHAFTDGNKRTAVIAMDMFFMLNNIIVAAPPLELGVNIERLADSTVDYAVPDLAGWLRTLDTHPAHEFLEALDALVNIEEPDQ